jgi:hypothetical protein
VKKFPHLVQLHRKLSGQGLVCVSLNVEQDATKDKAEVLVFLKKQEAAFANFIFRDKVPAIEMWKDKHEANGLPAYVLFDRSGKRIPVPDEKPEPVQKQIEALLAEK